MILLADLMHRLLNKSILHNRLQLSYATRSNNRGLSAHSLTNICEAQMREHFPTYRAMVAVRRYEFLDTVTTSATARSDSLRFRTRPVLLIGRKTDPVLIRETLSQSSVALTGQANEPGTMAMVAP
jgi:hypothetical protein